MMAPGLTPRRLLDLLQVQLQRCRQAPLADITADWTERDNVVDWLLTLNSSLKFSSDTMALAVTLFDRFIDLMKIQAKYLRCVGVSCLYVAVKINEEDEVVPSTRSFMKQTACGYTVSEVLRMERIILIKLNWDLLTPTSVDFVHILHALMMLLNPDLLDHLHHTSPSQHVAVIMRKLFTCLRQRALVAHGHVTLALALLSLELEQFTSCWFPVTLSLQRLVQVDNAELIKCREHITRHLAPLGHLQTPYQFSPSYLRKPLSIKRKVTPDSLSDGGGKRLYSDDVLAEEPAPASSCSSEARPESEDAIATPAIAT